MCKQHCFIFPFTLLWSFDWIALWKLIQKHFERWTKIITNNLNDDAKQKEYANEKLGLNGDLKASVFMECLMITGRTVNKREVVKNDMKIKKREKKRKILRGGSQTRVESNSVKMKRRISVERPKKYKNQSW